MRIYTLGYEGLSLRDYTELLVTAGVGVVLDVREHPWSQRPDFIRWRMAPALAEAGIDYVHVKSAGNPSHIRKTSQSVEECLTRYREHLESNGECLGELYSYLRLAFERGRPACLTCYERLPENCHRSALTDSLRHLDALIESVHLPPAERRRDNRLAVSTSSLRKSAFLKPQLLHFGSE